MKLFLKVGTATPIIEILNKYRLEKEVFWLAIHFMADSLPELCDNSKLKLVRDDEVPKLLKTHIFVRAVMSTKSILNMLAKQNIE